MNMQQNLLSRLTAITTDNELEQQILTDLLTVADPQGDDLLSHIEETYRFNDNNLESPLNYQDGINFLTKYNLMP